MNTYKRILFAMFFLLAGIILWLPLIHLFFKPSLPTYFNDHAISLKAKLLATHQVLPWTTPTNNAALNKMRIANAEWDFMSRTYLVLALSNMALSEPENKTYYLSTIDSIINDTLKLEKQHGIYYFLMDYAKEKPWVSKKQRSLFQDGEIALMLAARQAVMVNDTFIEPLQERINIIIEVMKQSPMLSGESYPDECWTFCNVVALAAVKLSDYVTKDNHVEFIQQWILQAKEKLIDKKTGLLISAYTFDGKPLQGPEGSSIWMAAHLLYILNKDFAQNQYSLSKKELGDSLFGFGYAREWPYSWSDSEDIDSGPIVPFLKASASSSGLAILGARTFNDNDFLLKLIASLNFIGFPMREKNGLKYCASNQVGDAVLLYSMVTGPLWQKIETSSP
ncbi:MAG: hypothetical protein ABIH42_03810 [Planctomycetota bacterium]